jgi:hypothetical protein
MAVMTVAKTGARRRGGEGGWRDDEETMGHWGYWRHWATLGDTRMTLGHTLGPCACVCSVCVGHLD